MGTALSGISAVDGAACRTGRRCGAALTVGEEYRLETAQWGEVVSLSDVCEMRVRHLTRCICKGLAYRLDHEA